MNNFCISHQEGKIESSHLLVHLSISTVIRTALEPKVGARNSVQGTHMGGRNPVTLAIITVSQGLHSQATGARRLNHISIPGNPLWDTGYISSTVKTRS